MEISQREKKNKKKKKRNPKIPENPKIKGNYLAPEKNDHGNRG
jgi:hypothetical protein